MISPTKTTIFILFFSFFQCFAQKHDLGKVTIEELQQAKHPADSSASAAVIFKKGKTSFQYSEGRFFILTEVEMKIKIYKPEGLGSADYAISYETGGQVKEEVRFSKAYTYNLVNGKVEKTKLKGESEFVENVNKFWSQRKISMPNVKVGSIIEFKYELRSPYWMRFPDWEFQESIPVDYAEYETLIPEYFKYRVRTKGFYQPKIVESRGPGSVIFHSESENAAFKNLGARETSQEVKFEQFNTMYKLENLPAIYGESFVNNIENYTSALSHEMSYTQFPNSEIKSYSYSWDDVARSIYEIDEFGGELNKSNYFESDLAPVLTGLSSNGEKALAIFSFVKDRMNWNKYPGYTCDEGVKTAFKNKVGNSAEINLMMVAMMRNAGINANPVLVSTRDNGIALYPSRSAYNYVICSMFENGELTLFDATSKNSQPNILPFRALNWSGRMIKKDGASVDVYLIPKSNSNEVTNIMAKLDAQGKVTGSVRKQYFDYNALYFREKFANVSQESIIENLEKEYNGLEIGEYSAQNKSELSKPVVENYSFTHNNAIEIIGDKMYLSPFVFLAQQKNPFVMEQREYPVDFMYPFQEKYNVSITLPDGYVVETLPESGASGIEDEIGNFKYVLSNNGRQLQFSYTENMNKAIIGVEYYEALKKYYAAMIAKQNEKIVLKKA